VSGPADSGAAPSGSDAAALAPGAGTTAATSPTGGTLAAALALIAQLPLTPAEKAEAVRHLLAEHNAKGKP